MKQFSILYLAGALGFFLYGIRMAEVNLRQAAGDKLRQRLGKLTERRIAGFLLGILMTLVFQSSTATTVMLIGLASVHFLSLKSATAVVLGADLGTTLLVLLLASFVRFNAHDLALTFCLVGFVLHYVWVTGRRMFLARAFLGFSFALYGLSLVGITSQTLRESELVRQLIEAISSNTGAAILFAALFTALVQSSAAVLGILLSFVGSGVMTVPQAFPFVLGANLGSTVVPMIAGYRAQSEGRRLAYIHLSLKILGITFALIFGDQIIHEIQLRIFTPSYQIAWIHIFLNAAIAFVGLPFVTTIARLATRYVKARENGNRFSSKYLDPRALESPELSFANVFREILRMAEITQEMCAQCLLPFEEVGTDTLQRLEELDDQVDHLDREIKFYLAKLAQSELNPDQSRRQMELLMITHNLESIGDVVTRDLVDLIAKMRRKHLSFSEEGLNDIKEFHGKVMENFQLAINSFASGDVELGRKVIRHKKRIAELEQEIDQRHLMRLHKGKKESFATSSVHLDLVGNLRRINGIITKMAYPVLDRRAG